jgi:hypothetical protein
VVIANDCILPEQKIRRMGDGHAFMQFIIRPDLIDCRELIFLRTLLPDYNTNKQEKHIYMTVPLLLLLRFGIEVRITSRNDKIR